MSYCIDGETPCWGGLSIPCKEREYPDAWDWVFKEMTRTLEESRKVCKEWCETANKLREKLEQMEMEKKVNKMTKAEAFEWLKCKKVDACGYLVEVQEKLFSVGIAWVTGDTFVANHGIYLFINEDGELTHGGCDEAFWKHHCYEEIKAEDILSLEIVEEKKEETENINIELEKWIGVIRDKFCCNGWSFVISASNFALIKGDLIEEKRPKE